MTEITKNKKGKISLSYIAKKYWDKFFPNMSPEQLYLSTTKDLPESTNLKITTHTTSPTLIFTNKGKDEAFKFTYTIKGKCIKYNVGNVCEKCQKHNISKTMQRNIFTFCKTNHLNRIDVAAINIGAYAWARMGFVPDLILWPIKRSAIARRFNAIKKKLPTNQLCKLTTLFNEVSKAVKSKDPKSIWIIADEKEPFYFDPKLSWGKALLLPHTSLPPNLDVDIDTDINYLGKFNLKDKDCVKRMKTYACSKKSPKKLKGISNG